MSVGTPVWDHGRRTAAAARDVAAEPTPTLCAHDQKDAVDWALRCRLGRCCPGERAWSAMMLMIAFNREVKTFDPSETCWVIRMV